jgi:hypothetical protein
VRDHHNHVQPPLPPAAYPRNPELMTPAPVAKSHTRAYAGGKPINVVNPKVLEGANIRR